MEERHKYLFAVVVAVVAMALALIYSRGDFLIGQTTFGNDGTAYAALGASIAHGHGFTLPMVETQSPTHRATTTHFPPGWPLLASPLIVLGVPAYIALPLLNWLLLGVLTFLISRVTLEFVGAVGAISASLLIVGCHYVLAMATRGLSELAFSTCVLLAVLLLARAEEFRRPLLWSIIAGAVLGYATAIRYAGIILVPLPLVVWFVRGNKPPIPMTKTLVNPCVASLAAGLMAGPFLLRQVLTPTMLDNEQGIDHLVAFIDWATLGPGFVGAYISLGVEGRLRAFLPDVIEYGAGIVVYIGIVILALRSGWRGRSAIKPGARIRATIAIMAAQYLVLLPILRHVVEFEIEDFRFLVPVLPFLAIESGIGASWLWRKQLAGRTIIGMAGLAITLLVAGRLWTGISLENKMVPFEAGAWVRTNIPRDGALFVEHGYTRLLPYLEGQRVMELPVADEIPTVAKDSRIEFLVLFPRRGGSSDKSLEFTTLPGPVLAHLALEVDEATFRVYRVMVAPANP